MLFKKIKNVLISIIDDIVSLLISDINSYENRGFVYVIVLIVVVLVAF